MFALRTKVVPHLPSPETISPNTGGITGGTIVTITGTNLANVTHVTIGNTCTNLVLVSPTQITCTTPAITGTRRTYDVILFNQFELNGKIANGFTFTEVPPVPTSVNPSTGPISGGTNVTIIGTQFTNVNSVNIGVNCTSLVVNPTQITCTTGVITGTQRIFDVILNKPGGVTGKITNGFTFTDVINFMDPILWLNAALLNLANGTQIDTWNSKSPATYQGVSQLVGVGTIKPKYYNNEAYPFVRLGEGQENNPYNGSCIKVPGLTSINANSGITVAVCFRTRSVAAEVFLFEISDSRTWEWTRIMVNTNNSTNYGLDFYVKATNSTNYTNTSLTPSITNTWQYFILRVNNTTVTTKSLTKTDTWTGRNFINYVATGFMIGVARGYGNNDVNSYNGVTALDIRDFLYYDRYLSNAEVTTIENNFKSLYNM